jgi:hypothetical protein
LQVPQKEMLVYYYCRCKTRWRERFRTDLAHDALLKEFSKVIIKQSYTDLFEQIVKRPLPKKRKEDEATSNTFDTEIEKSRQRIACACSLFLMEN